MNDEELFCTQCGWKREIIAQAVTEGENEVKESVTETQEVAETVAEQSEAVVNEAQTELLPNGEPVLPTEPVMGALNGYGNPQGVPPYGNQGYPAGGYQNNGYNNQGYGNQGYDNQGYANQGYGNLQAGYQNNDYQNAGYGSPGYGYSDHNYQQPYKERKPADLSKFTKKPFGFVPFLLRICAALSFLYFFITGIVIAVQVGNLMTYLNIALSGVNDMMQYITGESRVGSLGAGAGVGTMFSCWIIGILCAAFFLGMAEIVILLHAKHAERDEK
jgi:hypothetical protein